MDRTRALFSWTVALLLAAPAAAYGETFCVHDPAGCVGVAKQDLQEALDAANANGSGRDTIRIGVGLFDDGPAVDLVNNPVDIIGTALNQTAIRSSSSNAGLVILDIREPTTTISNLRVHHNSGSPSATGIKLAGAAQNILVTNQSPTGFFDGITMVGASASLEDSGVTVIHPNNLQSRAVFVVGGADVTIRDSNLSGAVGLNAEGGQALIQRTRIRATQGVVASGGASVQVSDSAVVVPSTFASLFQKAALVATGTGATTLNVDRVTAFATEGNSYGVWVAANSGAGNDATVDLQGSVVAGFGTDLRLTEVGGSSATMSTSWSAYRLGSVSVTGSPTFTAAPNNLDLTNVDPGFLDAGAAVDLRLAHDSPLVDAGTRHTRSSRFCSPPMSAACRASATATPSPPPSSTSAPTSTSANRQAPRRSSRRPLPWSARPSRSARVARRTWTGNSSPTSGPSTTARRQTASWRSTRSRRRGTTPPP